MENNKTVAKAAGERLLKAAAIIVAPPGYGFGGPGMGPGLGLGRGRAILDTILADKDLLKEFGITEEEAADLTEDDACRLLGISKAVAAKPSKKIRKKK